VNMSDQMESPAVARVSMLPNVGLSAES
jgi:hypothetical protein